MLDEELRQGCSRGPLHGLPVSVKVYSTSKGRKRLPRHECAWSVARADATVVSRLRAAGAVIIGKCNLHEFALGTTSDESAFGPVRNPHDTSRSPGGSSGGSAAAVAASLGWASIGSDTGGSVRIPAAACGCRLEAHIQCRSTYGFILFTFRSSCGTTRAQRWGRLLLYGVGKARVLPRLRAGLRYAWAIGGLCELSHKGAVHSNAVDG